MPEIHERGSVLLRISILSLFRVFLLNAQEQGKEKKGGGSRLSMVHYTLQSRELSIYSTWTNGANSSAFYIFNLVLREGKTK